MQNESILSHDPDVLKGKFEARKKEPDLVQESMRFTTDKKNAGGIGSRRPV
jgi:hypothetical protein